MMEKLRSLESNLEITVDLHVTHLGGSKYTHGAFGRVGPVPVDMDTETAKRFERLANPEPIAVTIDKCTSCGIMIMWSSSDTESHASIVPDIVSFLQSDSGVRYVEINSNICKGSWPSMTIVDSFDRGALWTKDKSGIKIFMHDQSQIYALFKSWGWLNKYSTPVYI